MAAEVSKIGIRITYFHNWLKAIQLQPDYPDILWRRYQNGR